MKKGINIKAFPAFNGWVCDRAQALTRTWEIFFFSFWRCLRPTERFQVSCPASLGSVFPFKSGNIMKTTGKYFGTCN